MQLRSGAAPTRLSLLPSPGAPSRAPTAAMENADSCWDAASSLVSRTYIQQGCQALARRRRQVTTLLSQRRLPEQGWDDTTIEMLLQVRGCV